MIHDVSSHGALATPPARPAMRSKPFSWRGLNSLNPARFILSRGKSTQARTPSSGRIRPRADTVTGEPCESGFEWSDECSVDAEGIADPERFEVVFEGVTDEDEGGAALGARMARSF
jgi:hypothetical protein